MARAQNPRIVELFNRALDQPAAQRDGWLRAACGMDDELFEAVQRLLRVDAATGDPLQELLSHSAQRLADDAGSLTGRLIGPWRVIAELGAGGMGRVFLAERADEEYQRRVALKLIRGFPDSASLERLRRERQILADLTHPNIAALYDGGTTGEGQPYLVLEYIDGLPIDQWCAGRRASPRERVRLLLQVCSTVHYAHQQLTIHRDIKPGNVMVTGDGTPKLLDFGIAKLIDEVAADSGPVTRVRHFSPHYSSPEQQAGKPISTASDVYSLGRLTETALLAGSDAERLPRELAAIVSRATAHDPADRYPSALALADDLRNWSQGRPVEALAPRYAYRLRKFLARHRVASAVVSVTLLAIVVLVVRIVIESERARAAESAARLEAANAEQVLGFLTDMIATARPDREERRDVTVAEVLEAGREASATAGIADPALRGRLRFALGSAWQALEQYQQAGEMLELAREDGIAAGDTDSAIRTLAAHLVVLTLQHEVESARQLAELGLTQLGQTPEVAVATRADLLNALGVWGEEAKELSQARAWLHQALELRRGIEPESTAVASTLHNLALVESALGDLEPALELIDQALAIKRAHLGELHPAYAESLMLRASLARDLGRYREARTGVAETLSIRARLFGGDNPALALDYNELANAHHDLGEYEEALANYSRAIELDRKAEPAGRNLYLYVNNRAAAHEDRGNLTAAVAGYRQSIELRRETFGADHPNTLRGRHNLARVLLAMQRNDEARAIATEVLQQRIAKLGEQHRDTLQSRVLVARIERAGNPGDADGLAELQSACETLLAVEAPNSLRALAARAALGRALLDAGRLDAAAALLAAAIDGYRTALDPEHPRAAALEVKLARIELLRGETAAAAQRLATQAELLRDRLAPNAPTLLELACLQAGTTEPDCWRSPR